MDVPFSDVGKIPVEAIFRRAKEVFLAAGGADCLYLLGAAWDCLGAVAPLEQELRTTVLANVPLDIWACLKRLGVNEPITGFGRLLEELP
jgi:maleate cis-trans isomerase